MNLSEALAVVGIDLEQLKPLCSEIILFGSRSVGAPDAKDWDVMLITDADPQFQISSERIRPTAGGLNYRFDLVDIVVVTTAQTEDPAWLGWELAGHVARYGLWAHGERGVWTKKTFVDPRWLTVQAGRISAQWQAYRRSRSLLSPVQRERQRTKIRQAIRRLRYLRAGQAVPPRSILDTVPPPR